VTVPAKYLFDIVQSLSDAQLVLKRLPNQHVELQCGTSQF